MARRKNAEIIYSTPLFRLFACLAYWLTVALCLLVNTLIFRIRVTGRANLDLIGRKKGCFVISNHSLFLDPAFITHAIYPRRTMFAAAPMHFAVPFFNTYLRLLGAFPIPSKNGLLQAKAVLRQELDKGLWIHFFPEGKMNLFGKVLQDFKWGVFQLAHDFNLPILPVTIITKPWHFFGCRLPAPFFTIKVVISRPLYPGSFQATGQQTRLNRCKAIRKMLNSAQTCMAAQLQAG